MRMSRGPSPGRRSRGKRCRAGGRKRPGPPAGRPPGKRPAGARRGFRILEVAGKHLEARAEAGQLKRGGAARVRIAVNAPYGGSTCSSRSSVCPLPPSVQSTMSLPGAAASMSTVSCKRTVMWRKFPAEPSSPSCGAGAATVSASPISLPSSSSLAPTSGAFRASAWYALSQFTAGARAFQEQTSSSTPISPVSSAITWTWLRQMLQASRRQAVLAEITVRERLDGLRADMGARARA